MSKIRIETLNSEIKVPPNWSETKNTENRNTKDPTTTKQILTQEDKINVEIL